MIEGHHRVPASEMSCSAVARLTRRYGGCHDGKYEYYGVLRTAGENNKN